MNERLELKLEHVGVVVNDIAKVAKEYEDLLGARADSPVVFDPLQKVNILFLRMGDGTRIELIEPVGPDSPARRTLKKGGGPDHLCYEVQDLQHAVDFAVAAGSLCVCPPTPAVAFGGRKVAFVVNRRIGVVEFVETGPAPE